MSDMQTTPSVPRQRSFLRFWLPWLILGIGVLGGAGVWLWPDQEWERAYRVLAMQLIVMVTGLLLVFWLLFLSGWRWFLRLGFPLALAAISYLTVRKVDFDGDVLPIFVFRWEAAADDVLDAHRQQHKPLEKLVKIDLTDSPADCPGFRGRLRDGVLHGPPLQHSWDTQPPRLIWRQPVGGGYAAFAVVGNLAVTIEQRRNQEAVVGYDTTTGQERWTYTYPSLFTETLGGDGPRATPTIVGRQIFSLGATGVLNCLETATGKCLWSVAILKDNPNLPWGMSGSPLVYDHLVVVNPGAQSESAKGRALVAYHRDTGKEVWASGDTTAGYCSPMLTTLGNERQIVLLDGEELAGYNPDTGKKLWQFPWNKTHYKINVAQPLILEEDHILIASGYGIGCAKVRVKKINGQWTVEQVWRNPRVLRCKFTTPVYHKGFLYGLDDGVLTCVDPKSGQRRWRQGDYGHGQMLLVDNLLLILSETGDLALVEANPEKYHELARKAVLKGRTWNSPAIARGKVFLRNHHEMTCYDLTGRN